MRYVAIVILLAGCASAARADFAYNFEDYTVGDLNGQGPWTTVSSYNDGEVIGTGALLGTKAMKLLSDDGDNAAVAQGNLNFDNIFRFKFKCSGGLDTAIRMVGTVATEMPAYMPVSGGIQLGTEYWEVWTFDAGSGSYGAFSFNTYDATGTTLLGQRTYNFDSAPSFNNLQIDSHGSSGIIIDNLYYGPNIPFETPEPTTLALLATGLIGLLAYAWRKRR